jgi:N-glycosylase/DNA lyase
MEGSCKVEENNIIPDHITSSQAIKEPTKSPFKRKVKISTKNTPKSSKVAESPSRKRKRKGSQKSETFLFSSDIAKLSPENEWIDLKIPPKELRPCCTLTNGQSFNWVVVCRNDLNTACEGKTPSPSKISAWGTSNETEWIGPIQDWVLSIREMPTTTLARVLVSPQHVSKQTEEKKLKELLFEYFQLSTPLEPLYAKWGQHDTRLAKIAPVLPGVRVVRQSPVECLFSFICSSNNNIPRITKMLASFRSTFGRRLLDIPVRISQETDIHDGNTESQLISSSMNIFSFPTLVEMDKATEQILREMGLGYRAKYIIQTRDLLKEKGGESFLLSLRKEKHDVVQEELVQFSGIGRKVADCVALFSLDQTDAIPVDVHVQHIASRDFDPSVLGEAKSITPKIYKRVGDLFRDRFVVNAGWAQSLLFAAELPSFRDVLPDDVVAEMDSVSLSFSISTLKIYF